MSNFPRPSLPALIARVTQQIQVNLPGATPALRRSVTGVLGKVLAQELQQEYAYLDFLADMFFVATAQGTYLDRKGSPLGVPRLPGATASGSVSFAGTVGATVPAGAALQTLDSTLAFTLSAAVTLGSAGTGSGIVTAQAAGAAANLGPGTSLVLVVAVAGVVPSATVGSGGLVGGLDLESDAAYRVRILQRQQLPPQGGAARDYVAWAKLVPGVTRAWVYPLARGAGTVDVAAVIDSRGGSAIIPTTPDLALIQTSLSANRPVTADVRAIALSISAVNVTINNLVAASGTSRAQALANAIVSLQQMFGGATPGGATVGDGIQPGATGGTIFVEQVSDVIAESVGVASFDLGAPSADVTAASETILVLGTVTAP